MPGAQRQRAGSQQRPALFVGVFFTLTAFTWFVPGAVRQWRDGGRGGGGGGGGGGGEEEGAWRWFPRRRDAWKAHGGGGGGTASLRVGTPNKTTDPRFCATTALSYHPAGLQPPVFQVSKDSLFLLLLLLQDFSVILIQLLL